MPKDWYEEPPAIVALVTGILVLLGYIVHELSTHAKDFVIYGLDPFAKVCWGGATDLHKVVVTGMGAEAAGCHAHIVHRDPHNYRFDLHDIPQS